MDPKNQISTNSWQSEIKARITRQHVIGCWVACGINLAWTMADFYTMKEWAVYVTMDLCVSLVIFLAVVFRKQLRIKEEALGLVPMMSIGLAAAYTYNTVGVDSFQEITLAYAAIFIGAGMFVLWRIMYSIIVVGTLLLANITFYHLFSPIDVQHYLLQGGVLVLSVALFMIVAVQVRYRLVRNDIISKYALKESREKLAKSEAEHRLLFYENPMPMLIFALEDYTILAVNDTMVNKYGYSRDEFLKMTIKDIRPKSEVAKLENDINKIKKGLTGLVDWTHQLKNGDLINVEITAKNVHYAGQEARMVSINDVTELKKNQEELIKAKQVAENAKDLQSQFLSNMSHEIRTPMNGIIGITRILQNTKLNEEQQKYMNAVRRSADNLMVIINDILDFSKIEAGKLTIEDTQFVLKEQLNVLEEIINHKLKEKDIYLKYNVSPEVPNTLIGDPVRLNQILLNLVGNAIKFTHKGGITLDIQKIHENEGFLSVQFDVRDTGIGIPEDKLDSIFSSFTQASSSTTRKFGGTGLGLTISKQLVELQQGEIWVTSTEGEGSTFSFTITYKRDKSEAHQKAVQKVESVNLNKLGKLKVLLVEDHAINQMLAIKVLEDWNFEVDLAENGVEAVSKAGDNAYDVILMDISMPEMDGYEASRRIRKFKSEMREVPIIAMTASALKGESNKCINAGMNDYITKPFDPDNLLKKISTQVEKKSA